MVPKVTILKAVNLSIADKCWLFATRERARIDRHWRSLTAANPAIWNGQVLMGHGLTLEDGALSASFLTTDYASFIAWRDWGWPDREVYNVFGSALVLSADGELIYGRMGAQSLNAGSIYPPGGSLEPDDADSAGRIDVAASVYRELAEETGLEARDAGHVATLVAIDGQRVSIGHVLVFPDAADMLVERCHRFIAGQAAPELSAMMVMRQGQRPAGSVPGYAEAFVRCHHHERALVPERSER